MSDMPTHSLALSDVAMDPASLLHGMDPASLLQSSVTLMKMELHVEFNNGMWWAMPHVLSDDILTTWRNGAQQVSFIWDWGDTRRGSFQPNGEETSINRYIMDFDTMQQRNLDNNRNRKVKVVYVVRGGG
jgi:hypothetical protein